MYTIMSEYVGDGEGVEKWRVRKIDANIGADIVREESSRNRHGGRMSIFYGQI